MDVGPGGKVKGRDEVESTIVVLADVPNELDTGIVKLEDSVPGAL